MTVWVNGGKKLLCEHLCILCDCCAVERSYGIVVDAGSSSSKVHLFEWPLHDGDPAKLLTIKPVVNEFGEPRTKKVEPGEVQRCVIMCQW